MRKLTMGLATALALLAGGAGAQDLKEVTIAHTPTLGGGIARVAQELGLFEKHGLKANLVQMDGASSTATAIISGSVDAAVSGVGELIAAKARGVDMVALTNNYNGLNATLIFSKKEADRLGIGPDAPVEERWKALDGALIATTSATSSFTVSTRMAAEAAGAKPRFTHMSQTAMQAALETGAIQAYAASVPLWTVAVLNGSGYAWLSAPKGDYPADTQPVSAIGVYMMRAKAEADPDVTNRVRAAFEEVSRDFVDRPDEVKAAIIRAFPSIDPSSVDVFYEVELGGFRGGELTVEGMARDIAYVKASGANLPGIDAIDPASLIAD